jgi:alpha-tubulin suppressor-like RCC1 family protein
LLLIAAPLVAAALASCGGGGGDLPLLGGGRTPDTSGTPVAVHPALTFLAIAPSFSHDCGITTDGIARCWGKDEYGELGSSVPMATCDDGLFRCSAAPLEVETTERFVSASTAWGHGVSCALTASGRAWCWGFGPSGQLGDGSTTSRSKPAQVAGNIEFRFLRLAPTGNLVCGMAKDGTPYCWGNSSDGQIGTGINNASFLVPTPVAWGRQFTTFDLGQFHACGLTEEGSAWCWGGNWYGELGIGSTGQISGPLAIPVPTLVSGGNRFRAIATSSNSTCALDFDGAAWCWGLDTGGPASNVPQRVAGAPVFASIQAAFSHTCGLTPSGEAWCWGTSGLSGGSGPLTRASTDVRFASLSHRPYCGLTADGKAWCWGNNDYHQLGR